MPLEFGLILSSRYRIDALLGEGGMGAVYRAFDTRLNLAIAIKENLDDPTGRLQRSTDPSVRAQLEKTRARFESEAQVLARLKHPGLPHVRDHFVIPSEGQYLVMEYIEGQDLQVLLKQSGPLREDRVIRIGLEVCGILEYLHGQVPPVIHRDIKPANLRVTPEGKIVLVDFGICKGGTDPVTKTAARAVSEGYSPPEMYGQRGATDARSDIYSLGATLMALSTGENPPSPTDRLVGIALPRFTQGIPTSEPLHETFEHALALKPEERFQTAGELRRALNSSLHQRDSERLSPRTNPTQRIVPTREIVCNSGGQETRVITERRNQVTPTTQSPYQKFASPTRRWPRVIGAIVLFVGSVIVWLVISLVVDENGASNTASGILFLAGVVILLIASVLFAIKK